MIKSQHFEAVRGNLMNNTVSTPLKSHFARLRRLARVAIAFRGVSWVLVFLLTTSFLAGFVDWRWHVGEQTRLLMLVGIFAGCGFLIWRMLLRPLMQPLSDLELAMKVEQRFPQFKDGLTSTVQFSQSQRDPQLGSPQLQKRVIAETLPALKQVNLDDVIEHRSVRTAITSAIVALLTVAVIIGWNQPVAGMAINRLLFPYSSAEWMRNTHLRILDDQLQPISASNSTPLRRVQGDVFKVYIENTRGELPQDITFEIKTPNGDLVREKLRKLTIRDQTGTLRQLCTASLVLDDGPIYFRAAGDDHHDMPWTRLDVVTAPRIETLQVKLIPPKYTGRTPESLPVGMGHIQALVGTEVQVRATSNVSLSSAKLRIKSEEPIPLSLSADGKSFQTTFQLREAGSFTYGFLLKDRQGFGNPNARRFNIRAIRDQVPTVRILSPTRDIRVTQNAIVPMKLLVEDDLRLNEVRLKYRIDGDSSDSYKVIPLEIPVDRYSWQLKEVGIGDRVRVHAEATDHYNLPFPETTKTSEKPRMGKSQTRTLTVVTADEKFNEISRAYSNLLNDLAKAAKTQQQARDTVAQLLLQLKKTNALRPNIDIPVLRRVERTQHEVTTRLTEAGSVESNARDLIEELNNNRLNRPDLKRKLERILLELSSLRKFTLKKIEASLTLVRKTYDAAQFEPHKPKQSFPSTSSNEQRSQLQFAQNGQDVVLAALNDLIDELKQWRNWRELFLEINGFIAKQSQLNQQTSLLRNRTLGLSISELTNQQKADLAKFAESQRRLADRLSRFHKDMDRFQSVMMQENSPNLAVLKSLDNAKRFLQTRDIISQMNDTSDRIDNNQLGRATTSQTTILEDLKELKLILENREVTDLESLIQKQKQSERDLAEIHNRQLQLIRQTERTEKIPNMQIRRKQFSNLAAKQTSLQKDLDAVTRQIRRLLASNANTAARRASQNMSRASTHLENNNPNAGLTEQNDAANHLEQARRALAVSRANSEAQLAREMLMQIAGTLESFLKQQQQIIDESEQLAKEHRQKRRFSRRGFMTLDKLQEEQKNLHSQLGEFIKKIEAELVLARVLNHARDHMQQAARFLAQTRQKPIHLKDAIGEELNAHKQLLSLISTMKPQGSSAGQHQAGNSATRTLSTQNPSAISNLANWKLLKSLQSELLRKTEKLHTHYSSRTISAEDFKSQLQQLANEQDQLADLAAKTAGSTTREIPDASAPKTDKENPKTQSKPLSKKDTPPSGIREIQQRIIKTMRSTAEQLDQQKSGTSTQKQQQQIVRDLEILIQRVQKQQPKTSAGNHSAQPQNGMNPSHKKSNKQTPPKTSSKSATNNSTKPRKSVKKSPSSKNKSAGGTGTTQKQLQSMRNSVIREFWGHLPEPEKQRLGNVAGERYLPGYKSLISKYFESLAEDR
ncbi:MAG: hypothetical protein Tsb009_24070 [Planctomycetaceae bacterium]